MDAPGRGRAVPSNSVSTPNGVNMNMNVNMNVNMNDGVHIKISRVRKTQTTNIKQ